MSDTSKLTYILTVVVVLSIWVAQASIVLELISSKRFRWLAHPIFSLGAVIIGICTTLVMAWFLDRQHPINGLIPIAMIIAIVLGAYVSWCTIVNHNDRLEMLTEAEARLRRACISEPQNAKCAS